MPEVEPEMGRAFQETVAAFRRAGVATRAVDIAGMLKMLDAATADVMFFEGARVHERRWKEHGKRLLDLADLVEKGLTMSVEQYDGARRQIAAGKAYVSKLFRTTPIIVVPAATGPAPHGLATTGDPRMNAPWTALGTPAISIPMATSGLPLGLQITADRGRDASVLRTAARIHRLLHA
jgi:Asp-tRNA(Asn)/Glu-tRNA(Gln) amidotransferase A subunit family amidase